MLFVLNNVIIFFIVTRSHNETMRLSDESLHQSRLGFVVIVGDGVE